MEAGILCLFTSQVWCTAACIMWGWKDLQDTSVFSKHKLLVWMRVIKTNAFLALKLEKHYFFPLILNHNSGFQKDVLEPGSCQAFSKVFYLTKRGYGRDLPTRRMFQKTKLNRIPSSEAWRFSMEKTKSIGSLDSQEVTLVLFTLRFVWGPRLLRRHCFCTEQAAMASALISSWNRVAISRSWLSMSQEWANLADFTALCKNSQHRYLRGKGNG